VAVGLKPDAMIKPLLLSGFAAFAVLTPGGVRSATATPPPLPSLSADSLAGTNLRFPGDLHGKPAILIVAYDRSASDALEKWSHALNTLAGSKAQIFAVVDAAGAPFFVHGAIKNGLMNSAPEKQPEHRSNILITFDRGGWDKISPAGPKDQPGIVAVNASGAILLARRAAYSDAAAADVLKLFP
jgi:hypothetical protein